MASGGIFHFTKVFIGLGILPLLSFQSVSELNFKKQLIASESAESVGVFDVNGDQNIDIVYSFQFLI